MQLRKFLRISLPLVIFILLSTCSSSKKTTETEPNRDEFLEALATLEIPAEEEPDTAGDTLRHVPVDIDSLMQSMTVREKIGQLFIVPANGNFLNEESEEFNRLKQLIADLHVGGIIFFRGDIYDQAILTNKLQRLSKIPLWITQDMEYGAAMRVREATRFTPAMGIAATGKISNAYLVGKITAREAKYLGVHQIFAPVLDVNNNPKNPVINVRSFSGDPRIVSDFGNAFIAGVESENIISTAKHFPGHGDTDLDSHLKLPVVNHSYARLDSVELIPFRSTIQYGLKSIMSAHIAFPQISLENGLPATLDSTMLNDILIDSLNFDGVVVTDGLEMNGIASKFSPGRAVVRALNAGADLMLISPDIRTAIDEITVALQTGEITLERINKSVKKILTWKHQFHLFENKTVQIEELSAHVAHPQYRAIADRIARESVTILKNEDDIIPIRAAEYPKILFLSVADDESGNTGSSFARELRKYHPDVTFKIYDQRSSEEEKKEILKAAEQADLIIIGSFIFLRYLQPIQLNDEQALFVRKIQQMNKPSVLVSFGNPYVLQELPDTDVHVLGWTNSRLQTRNTTPALFGGSDVVGALPINIPGMYTIGEGLKFKHSGLRFDRPESVHLASDSLNKIDRLMYNAVKDSVFPGGVVAVVKDGVLAYHKAFGYHDYSKTKAVQKSDVYDLASLTKVVATTTAVMKLVSEGKISLNDPVRKFIPEFDAKEKRKIKLKDLLLHQSGLPAFRTYVDKFKERDEIIDAIKNEPLMYEPGTDYVYSDLGMILLAEIISKVSGKEFDKYLRSQIYYPMGMYSTFFNPSDVGDWMNRRIPPTEIDTVFNRGVVQGAVHDERAWYMDGVAGHAGLFSNAEDLAKFATMLLNEGAFMEQSYIKPEVVKKFTTKQSDLSGRGFGFDRKAPTGFSTAGQQASEDTFGHLGFTGTSMWIDRSKNMAVILLTNRTWPYRSYGENISQIRAKIADIAYSSIRN